MAATISDVRQGAVAAAPGVLPCAIHVINLDRATERLDGVTCSFDAALGGSGIALNRYAAMDADEARRLGVPGGLSWAEKACFLSHANCVRAAAEAGHPAWIVEDDVVFGGCTRQRVEQALAAIGDSHWDILFTNIHATDPHTMLDLFQLDRELRGRGVTRALELSRMAFLGAPSYLVNPASAARIMALVERCERLDMAWDIWLKYLAGTGQLTCLCVFPFATSLADVPTQIQPQSSSRLLAWWTAFSRLLWEEGEPVAQERELAALEAGSRDERAGRLGRILAGMAAEPALRGHRGSSRESG